MGFRIIKGGGTFVMPVIEKVEVLSLEVVAIELPKSRTRNASGAPVEADCVAQVKIKDNDVSILAASQYFLGKKEGEIRLLVTLVLEKNLRAVLESLNTEELGRVEACAARVQTATSADLAKLGMAIVSFTIRSIRV
jgi:flotillin